MLPPRLELEFFCGADFDVFAECGGFLATVERPDFLARAERFFAEAAGFLARAGFFAVDFGGLRAGVFFALTFEAVAFFAGLFEAFFLVERAIIFTARHWLAQSGGLIKGISTRAQGVSGCAKSSFSPPGFPAHYELALE